MRTPPVSICVSLGESLVGDVDDDHVPPRQLHAKELRKTYGLNLLTIPTHRACNRAFQLDEEYFVHSLAPVAPGSTSGKAVLGDLFRQYRTGRNVPLSQKVLAKFESCPSGLHLPPEKVVKRFAFSFGPNQRVFFASEYRNPDRDPRNA